MDMQITSLLSHSIQEELASVNNTDVFSSSDIVRGITTTNEKNPKKSAFPKKATLLTFAYIDTGNADFRSAQRGKVVLLCLSKESHAQQKLCLEHLKA